MAFVQITAESVRGEFHMPLVLLPAEGACPITHDDIGSPTYTTPYSDKPCPSVLHKHPHLQRAVISACSHQFDARALVVHFLRNSMSCPLCRSGDPSVVMSASASFPNEEWILALERQLRAQPELPRLIIHDTALREPSVMVSLFLFDSAEEGSEPIHGMQFPMVMEPIQMRHSPAQATQERILIALHGLGVLPLSQVLVEYQLDEQALRTLNECIQRHGAVALSGFIVPFHADIAIGLRFWRQVSSRLRVLSELVEIPHLPLNDHPNLLFTGPEDTSVYLERDGGLRRVSFFPSTTFVRGILRNGIAPVPLP